jgi:hypothetical protein
LGRPGRMPRANPKAATNARAKAKRSMAFMLGYIRGTHLVQA